MVQILVNRKAENIKLYNSPCTWQIHQAKSPNIVSVSPTINLIMENQLLKTVKMCYAGKNVGWTKISY